MKTVVISRNSKELARVPLNRRSLLAGRSPSCEAVIRTKGIQPVQFMIEHVAENLGDVQMKENFDEGFWTLIDISEVRAKESEKRKSSSGAGIVLDNNKQTFNGFEFQVVEDTLHETDLKKGVLSRNLADLQAGIGKDKNVLEIVHFRKDLDIVSNISHVHRNKTSKKFKPFPQSVNQLVFEWPAPGVNHGFLREVVDMGGYEVYKKSEAVTDIIRSKKYIEFYEEDVVLVETETDIYYLRLVPDVEVVLEKFSWSKDFIIRMLLAILAVVSMLTFLVKNFEPAPEKPAEPPRVVEIDIPPPVETAKPPPPAPKPEPEPEPVAKEPPPPPPKPKETKVVEKKDEPPKQIKSGSIANENKGQAKAAATSVINRPNDKPRAGLNNNSQPKNVNTVGLLAKLKTGQTPTNQKISADKVLNQGIQSETMTGDKGTVVVNKPPVGVIGKQTQPINPNALAEASTTLSGAKTVDTKSAGNIAIRGGTGTFSSGSSLKGLNTNAGGSGSGLGTGSGSGSSSTGFDRGEAVQTSGGLDKEAVRKALRENRRAIANCYETALLTKKELNGRMTFQWVISPVGDVTTIKLKSSDLAMPNFESCVEAVIKSIRFPQAPNRQPTTVIYPFAFQGKK